jgi:hypothetical protein
VYDRHSNHSLSFTARQIARLRQQERKIVRLSTLPVESQMSLLAVVVYFDQKNIRASIPPAH